MIRSLAGQLGLDCDFHYIMKRSKNIYSQVLLLTKMTTMHWGYCVNRHDHVSQVTKDMRYKVDYSMCVTL